MFNRCAIVVAATTVCWLGAGTGVFINLPEKAHSMLLAGGLAGLIWLRNAPEQRRDLRQLKTTFYEMGVDHGRRTQPGAQGNALVHRLPQYERPGRRFGGHVASVALLAVVCLLVVAGTAALADSMERVTPAVEAVPALNRPVREYNKALVAMPPGPRVRAELTAGRGPGGRTVRPSKPRGRAPAVKPRRPDATVQGGAPAQGEDIVKDDDPAETESHAPKPTPTPGTPTPSATAATR